VTPVVEAVAIPAPAQIEDDDAIPTRRTMETLRQSTAAKESSAEDAKVGFFAALSTKTKLVLLAIVTAVVLALVIICVNTAIINSINADITNLRGKVDEQQATYAALNEEKEGLEDPASEIVAQWAQEHGMTKEA
ncbi:MAG: hypothetical protein K2N74_00125, partial [Clostridiales bacterium]|nr:hypothetical protein [Clostridiales bacterium]